MGTISSYGLVWRLLQSNQAGHFNATHPITVYWTIADKQSIHRSGTNWNDGCELVVPDNATLVGAGSSQPVTMAPVNTALPTGGLYPNRSLWNVSTTGRTTTHSQGTYPYALPA